MPDHPEMLPCPPAAILERASLFLDVDGTLAEFVSPAAPFDLGEEVRGLIRNLAERLEGRVAIVSGRALANLVEIIGHEGIELAGSHGLERRRADGRVERPGRPETLDRLAEEVRVFAETRGLNWENKPGGAAIHFRDTPGDEAAVDDFAREIAARYGLRHQPGAMVRELRVVGPDKGDIVRELMREPPFASGLPVFVGDDLTDEDGFTAAAALGGAGVLVGDQRQTAARYRLPSVAAARRWLGGMGEHA